MAVPSAERVLTEREYLEIERAADFRSEFFEGEMFAMAGGTFEHSLIMANLITELGLKLRGRRCMVLESNMKVKVEATGLFAYPDVTVVCGERQLADEHRDVLLNPLLLAEVLSESTEAYDRGGKFEQYRRIPSLQEYLLVSTKARRIEQYVKQADGAWLLREAAGMDAVLESPTLGVGLALAEVYANVEWEPGRGAVVR